MRKYFVTSQENPCAIGFKFRHVEWQDY